MRETSRKTKNSTSSTSPIPTGGEVFADGTVIELIEDLTQVDGLGLLKWDGRKTVVARRVVHRRQAYIPLSLHPSVRRALRLAPGCGTFTSTADLFAELVAILLKYTDLREQVCCQLAGFVFASWLADRLPAPINLELWSPVATDGAQVLRLLSCLCRQALALSGTNARDLCLLPTALQATLLIFRPASGRRTLELLSTCGWQGFQTARSGEFGEFVGSVALSSDAPLKDRSLDPMLEIAVAPSKRILPVLDQRAQQELAQDFLPKLLRYRLLHHKTIVGSGSSDAGFAGASSQLATGLRACFSDEPKLRDQQLALLVDAGQNGHEARATDPRVPLIEALLVRCHEKGRQKIHVAEIALDLNAIFSLQGLELSSRMVGSILKAVGVHTRKLDRKGRGVMLDASTRKLIHVLARLHDVPSACTPFTGCAECSQLQPAEN